MAKEETNVSKATQVEAGNHDCWLFRNNRGLFFTMSGQKTRAGLETKGASDNIGMTSIIITPEMVGKKIAVFTAVESKKPDWKKVSTPTEQEQEGFINFVRHHGGFAFFCNDAKSFKKHLDNEKQRLYS